MRRPIDYVQADPLMETIKTYCDPAVMRGGRYKNFVKDPDGRHMFSVWLGRWAQNYTLTGGSSIITPDV